MIVLRPIESLSDISPEIRRNTDRGSPSLPPSGGDPQPLQSGGDLGGNVHGPSRAAERSRQFCYIIRSAGCSLRHSEFQISYAVAIGSVSAIAPVGHTNCGMGKWSI